MEGDLEVSYDDLGRSYSSLVMRFNWLNGDIGYLWECIYIFNNIYILIFQVFDK